VNAPANRPPSPIDTCRYDGWTQDRRRIFLISVAEGHPVEHACAHVGKSKVSAYALRRRDPGFALAWSAALLRARFAMAEKRMNPVVDGQLETVTRKDGSILTRHRFDNRYALAQLSRLDRRIAQLNASGLGRPR
jgi:hypothetical protein